MKNPLSYFEKLLQKSQGFIKSSYIHQHLEKIPYYEKVDYEKGIIQYYQSFYDVGTINSKIIFSSKEGIKYQINDIIIIVIIYITKHIEIRAIHFNIVIKYIFNYFLNLSYMAFNLTKIIKNFDLSNKSSWKSLTF